MQQTVGTTPVPLGAGSTLTNRGYRSGKETEEAVGLSRPVLQNLGPGEVYIDTDPEVAVGTGLKLAVDAPPLEFGARINSSSAVLYAVATADSDVRIVELG